MKAFNRSLPSEQSAIVAARGSGSEIAGEIEESPFNCPARRHARWRSWVAMITCPAYFGDRSRQEMKVRKCP
jgi:hypothetical protein